MSFFLGNSIKAGCSCRGLNLLKAAVLVAVSALFCLESFAGDPKTVSVGDTTYGVSGTFSVVPYSNTQVQLNFSANLYGVFTYSIDSESFRISQLDPSQNEVGQLNISNSGWTVYITRSPDGLYNYSGGVQGINCLISGGFAIYDGIPGQTYTFKGTAAYSGQGMGDHKSDTISIQFGELPLPLTQDLGPARVVQLANLVAEPVNVTTGEFYTDAVDLRVNGTMPIEIRRTYSSRNTATSEIGYGWLTGYSSYIAPTDDLAYIQAADLDGTVLAFRRVSGSNVWKIFPDEGFDLTNSSGGSKNLYNSQIVQTTAGDGTVSYQWLLPDGSVRNYVVREFPVGDYPRREAYLDSLTDNRGNFLAFSFGNDPTMSEYGKIIGIRSSSGGLVTLTYNRCGRLSLATASDGRAVSYGYDFRGDLTDVQLPDGQRWSYVYGPGATGPGNHRIIKELKPDGRILQNVYDPYGKVTQQKATVGLDMTPVVTATFDYSVPGQTTVSDAFGKATVYQYTNNLITKVTDPLGNSITRTWYTNTDAGTGAYVRSLQSETDHRGLVTTYRYDSQGNIVQTQVTGDLEGDSTSSETATTTANYSSLNLPTSVTDASGITTDFSYADANYPYLPTQVVTSKGGVTLRTDKLEYTAQLDSTNPGSLFAKGLLARKTVALGSTEEAVTEYAYNAAGLVTQQTAYTGTSDPNVVTTFGYDARGELTATTDADGRSTVYTYDAMSRPTSKVVKDENGNVLGTWTTTYNANGEVAQVDGPRSGPEDWVQHDYDGAGRPKQDRVFRSQAKSDGSGVEAAAVATTSYVHDFFGNLVSAKQQL